MKRCTLIAVSALIACGVVGHANAQIVPIGEFTGDHSEGFESLPFGFFTSHPVFDNTGVVRTIDGSETLIIASSWSFMGIVFPHSGGRFMGSASALPEWVFDVPALQFGGFFTTNSGTSDAVAHFFDVDNNSLGSLPVIAPADNSWVWNGWETQGVGISRVVIEGNNPFGGGFIMHDDMQYTAIPAPGVLGLFAIGLGMARRRRRTV
ncbi:MAG: hypothetical protein V3T84_08180 [Phycisphaerales bacterium]